MEIEPITKKANEIEFVIKGERHTLTNLLRDVLQKDSKVEFVAYSLEHPMDQDAKFILKTKGAPAKKVLQDALKEIEDDLADFKQNLKKAAK